MDLLIGFCNYCYPELLVQNDQQYAEDTYQFLFDDSLYGYYVAFLSILAIIQWQLRIPVPSIFKHNFLVVLINAVFIYLPFYVLISWLLGQLSAEPLQHEINHG